MQINNCMKDFAHEKLISNQLKGDTLPPKERLRSTPFERSQFLLAIAWLRGQQCYAIFLLWWFDSCQSTHLVLNFQDSHPHRDAVIQSPQNINPAFCSLNLHFRECQDITCPSSQTSTFYYLMSLALNLTSHTVWLTHNKAELSPKVILAQWIISEKKKQEEGG